MSGSNDPIGEWNRSIFNQLPGMTKAESELMLELTIPLEADQDHFRIGWGLKVPRTRKWVALSSGRAVWSRRNLEIASAHIYHLMDGCNQLLEPIDPRDRR